jgi:hypothetical protein
MLARLWSRSVPGSNRIPVSDQSGDTKVDLGDE